jgi:hypothetical protein
MPYPSTKKSTSLGLPVLGFNKRDPLPTMGAEYCVAAVNMEPEAQYLRVRNGYVVQNQLTDSLARRIYAIAAYGDSKLFAYVQNYSGNHTIYDITTNGGETVVATLGTSTPTRATVNSMARSVVFSTENNYSTGSYSYDGTSWTAWGFTYGGSPIGGNVVITYKGRVYIFETSVYAHYTGAAYMYYGGLDAITGATTRVDISSLLKDSGVVRWASVLTSPSMRSDELYLAFGTHSGQVFVYAGDNPGASNWTLVGQFQTARPLYWNSIVHYNNDILILTERGVVSVQRLFQVGSEASDATISEQIDKHWQDVVALYDLTTTDSGGGLAQSRASGAYLASQNKLYFLLHGYVNRAGNSNGYETDIFSGSNNYFGTMFVYNTVSKGWTIHQVSCLMNRTSISGSQDISGGLTVFRGELYLFSQIFVYRLTSNQYYDNFNYSESQGSSGSQGSTYPFYLDSACYSLSSTLDPIKVEGVTAVVKNDRVSSVGVQMGLTADYGYRQTAVSTSSALNTGYNSIFFSIGESGFSFQYNLSGDTTAFSDTNGTSTGFRIYNIGVIYR